MRNLYEVLGVAPDASLADIRRAYRNAARVAHPDAGGDRTRWEELKLAHDILIDPERRARYDRTGATDDPMQDPTFAAMMGALSAALEAVLESCSTKGMDVRKVDVAMWMRRSLDIAMGKAKKFLLVLERDLETLRRLEGRFTEPDGDDLLGKLAAHRLEEMLAKKRNVEIDIRGMEDAAKALAGVSYRTDAGPSSMQMQMQMQMLNLQAALGVGLSPT